MFWWVAPNVLLMEEGYLVGVCFLDAVAITSLQRCWDAPTETSPTHGPHHPVAQVPDYHLIAEQHSVLHTHATLQQ